MRDIIIEMADIRGEFESELYRQAGQARRAVAKREAAKRAKQRATPEAKSLAAFDKQGVKKPSKRKRLRSSRRGFGGGVADPDLMGVKQPRGVKRKAY